MWDRRRYCKIVSVKGFFSRKVMIKWRRNCNRCWRISIKRKMFFWLRESILCALDVLSERYKNCSFFETKRTGMRLLAGAKWKRHQTLIRRILKMYFLLCAQRGPHFGSSEQKFSKEAEPRLGAEFKQPLASHAELVVRKESAIMIRNFETTVC